MAEQADIEHLEKLSRALDRLSYVAAELRLAITEVESHSKKTAEKMRQLDAPTWNEEVP